MKTPIKRFLKMTTTSTTCFLLDLAIIYTLVELTHLHYTIAVIAGFITAHSPDFYKSKPMDFM